MDHTIVSGLKEYKRIMLEASISIGKKVANLYNDRRFGEVDHMKGYGFSMRSLFYDKDKNELTAFIQTTDSLLESNLSKYKFSMDVHRLSKRHCGGEYDSSYWNEPFMKEYAAKEVDALEEKLVELKDKRDNFKDTFFKKNPYRAEVLLYEEKLACVYELLERK